MKGEGNVERDHNPAPFIRIRQHHSAGRVAALRAVSSSPLNHTAAMVKPSLSGVGTAEDGLLESLI